MPSSLVRHEMFARAAALTGLLAALLAAPIPLAAGTGVPASETASRLAVYAMKKGLDTGDLWGDALASKDFAEVALTKADAAKAKDLLWDRHARQITKDREAEINDGKLVIGSHTMPIYLKTFGTEPKEGWSLWISMHGGGGAPKAVNDSQWENQKRLYRLEEGIYAVPRARPTTGTSGTNRTSTSSSTA